MQRVEVRVGLGDQRVVHGDRDGAAVELRGDDVGIAMHLRVDRVGLHLTVQRRAERALELLHRAEERVHHELAVGAVLHAAVLRVGRLVERDLRAVGQRHLRPRQVGRRQQRVVGDRVVAGQPEARDDRLALRVERVRRGPQDVVEHVAIDAERLVLREEAVDLLLADRQHLGRHERRRLVDLRVDQLYALVQRDAGGVARVLVVDLGPVHGEASEALLDVVQQVEARPEARRRLAELALAAAEPVELRLHLRGVGVPGGLRRVEVREIPAVLFGFGVRGAGQQDGQDGRDRSHLHSSRSFVGDTDGDSRRSAGRWRIGDRAEPPAARRLDDEHVARLASACCRRAGSSRRGRRRARRCCVRRAPGAPPAMPNGGTTRLLDSIAAVIGSRKRTRRTPPLPPCQRPAPPEPWRIA